MSMDPYYSDDSVVIYNCDLREFDRADFAACTVTSPPYNVGIEYDVHVDAMSLDDYAVLTVAACGVIGASLVDTGRAFVNVAPSVGIEWAPSQDHSGNMSKPRLPLVLRWGVALEQAGLTVRDVGAWTSQRGSGTAWGSWQLPSAPNLRGDWEAFIVAHRGEWPRCAPPGMAGWRDTIGGWPELTSNVWNLQPEQRKEHPVPFPVEFAQRCIRLSTWPGETVFDPFMGSGTTLLAAKSLSRRAVGVELSERYCEIAASRLAAGVLDFGGAA